jgi:hypothetical protein
MSTWKKEKPYTGTIHQGCLNCPPVEQVAPMDMVIAVGFGIAQITRDSDFVYSEGDEDDFPTLAQFEEMAAADPDHDWRCLLVAPLRGREYQRHDKGKLVLIASDDGFA